MGLREPLFRDEAVAARRAPLRPGGAGAASNPAALVAHPHHRAALHLAVAADRHHALEADAAVALTSGR